jgi:hypothetical protein
MMRVLIAHEITPYRNRLQRAARIVAEKYNLYITTKRGVGVVIECPEDGAGCIVDEILTRAQVRRALIKQII